MNEFFVCFLIWFNLWIEAEPESLMSQDSEPHHNDLEKIKTNQSNAFRNELRPSFYWSKFNTTKNCDAKQKLNYLDNSYINASKHALIIILMNRSIDTL